MTDKTIQQERKGSGSSAHFDQCSIAVAGDHANVQGGIHYHFYYSPPADTHSRHPNSHCILYEKRQDDAYRDKPAPPAPTGGALDVNSSFYIQRQADREVLDEVMGHRGLVTVRGARQTGKTSLIQRIHQQAGTAGDEGVRSVFIDFQSLPRDIFDTSDAIWQAIVDIMVSQLHCDQLWQPEIWDTGRRTDWNLDRFFDRAIFGSSRQPLLICLDSVDRVMGRPGQADFFALMRSLYNRGALDQTWSQVRWLLSTSSEPVFFIENLNQSPFNVGQKVLLSSFTSEETIELAKCYGHTMDEDLLMQVMEYIGGRPYLVNILLYQLRKDPESLASLLDAATGGHGVFTEYLNPYLIRFQEDPDLTRAMRWVIDGQGCGNIRLAERLQSAGLAVRGQDQKLVCACRLYADYFGRNL